jgi:hypothetical protein
MVKSPGPAMADTTQTADELPRPGSLQDLHTRCGALLEEWRNSDAVDERTPTDIGAIIFEAQVLLVCEGIRRGNMTDRRIQQAVSEIGQQKHQDILDTVRLRLYERSAYVRRLKTVETVFQQLIRGDMNRTVTRPAKYTPHKSKTEDA